MATVPTTPANAHSLPNKRFPLARHVPEFPLAIYDGHTDTPTAAAARHLQQQQPALADDEAPPLASTPSPLLTREILVWLDAHERALAAVVPAPPAAHRALDLPPGAVAPPTDAQKLAAIGESVVALRERLDATLMAGEYVHVADEIKAEHLHHTLARLVESKLGASDTQKAVFLAALDAVDFRPLLASPVAARIEAIAEDVTTDAAPILSEADDMDDKTGDAAPSLLAVTGPGPAVPPVKKRRSSVLVAPKKKKKNKKAHSTAAEDAHVRSEPAGDEPPQEDGDEQEDTAAVSAREEAARVLCERRNQHKSSRRAALKLAKKKQQEQQNAPEAAAEHGDEEDLGEESEPQQSAWQAAEDKSTIPGKKGKAPSTGVATAAVPYGCTLEQLHALPRATITELIREALPANIRPYFTNTRTTCAATIFPITSAQIGSFRFAGVARGGLWGLVRVDLTKDEDLPSNAVYLTLWVKEKWPIQSAGGAGRTGRGVQTIYNTALGDLVTAARRVTSELEVVASDALVLGYPAAHPNPLVTQANTDMVAVTSDLRVDFADRGATMRGSCMRSGMTIMWLHFEERTNIQNAITISMASETYGYMLDAPTGELEAAMHKIFCE